MKALKERKGRRNKSQHGIESEVVKDRKRERKKQKRKERNKERKQERFKKAPTESLEIESEYSTESTNCKPSNKEPSMKRVTMLRPWAWHSRPVTRYTLTHFGMYLIYSVIKRLSQQNGTFVNQQRVNTVNGKACERAYRETKRGGKR